MPDDDRLDEAADVLRGARKLVVFTGAGVSRESGIPTFRDEGGFWTRFPPEQFACWHGLMTTALLRPAMLAEFLVEVIGPVALAKPNPAHEALARLERFVTLSIITQNVDGLHQEAGNRRVREVHGSFFDIVTLAGQPLGKLQRRDLQVVVERLARTQTGLFKLARLARALHPLMGLSLRGLRRPRLILFGDALAEPDWSDSQTDVRRCDVILIVGTSGSIYPAAGLPAEARAAGARVITVDPFEPGPCNFWLRGQAGDLVPRLVERAFPTDDPIESASR